MTDYLKSLLEKCAYAKLDNYDSQNNVFHIPKYIAIKYEIGKCYLVSVSDNIINNINTTVAINWNHCTAPRNKYYKAFVSKIILPYIYLDCLAYDYINNTDLAAMYSGWFNINDLTILKIL